MRITLTLDLTKPPNQTVEEWVSNQLATLNEAAHEDAAIDAAAAFNGIDHGSYTKLETFNPATVTLPELARALATFIQYIQNQGPRKG